MNTRAAGLGLLAVCLLAAPGAAQTMPTATLPALPLSFEPNRGQSDPRVKFLARSPGLTVFLTSLDAVLVTREGAVRMRLLGARPDTEAQGIDVLSGRSHSFIGRDPMKWRTDIPTYERVRYRGVYPGIDLVYYGARQKQLEYDFVVAPGADPRAIRLGFDGVDALELHADGDLVLRVGPSQLRFGKPSIYQDVDGARRQIRGGWRLDGALTVGLQLAPYDVTRPLVIDPVVSVATFLGGTGTDQAFGITLDAAGNVYVSGNTTSVDFPTTLGSFATTPSGGIDAFVVKVNRILSNVVYSTYLGGTGDDAARGIAVDATGNAYITGFTNSLDFPTTASFQTLLAGSNDAFVVKLNSTGSALVYSTYLGGIDSDVGLGIAVDSAGNAYVTGGTFSVNFPTTGVLQPTLGGNRDAFVTKVNATGSALAYSTFLGGAVRDVGNGIAVDGAGAAYVTGSTSSPDFPTTPGSFQIAFGGPLGGTDAFLTKISTAGALVYSTYLGGSASDEGLDLTVDSGGNAYVTGTTSSTNFPASGTFTFSGATQAFITELNPSGVSIIVSRAVPTGTLDSSARDPAAPNVGVGIARDLLGNIYIAGSEVRCVGVGCTVNTDAFVVALDPTVTTTNPLFVGGSGDDFGLDLAVDALGNVFLTGETSSGDFPVTSPTIQPTFGGVTDAFVVEITGLSLVTASGSGASGGDGSGGGGCFIATAAFGSPMARDVRILREFRDRVLVGHAAGRGLVAAYYRISPPLARVIARYQIAKMAVRAGLRPIASMAFLVISRPVLAFSLAVGAGILLTGLLVVVLAGRRATMGRRALAVVVVGIAVFAGAVALLDDSVPTRAARPAADSEPRRESSVRAKQATRAAPPAVVEVNELEPGRYDVVRRGRPDRLPSLAGSVVLRPTLAGLRVESAIGDGILTREGLSVTDPKLAALIGIERGDTIVTINGHPPTGGFFLALVKLRRDPDSGSIHLEVERDRQRIERRVVIR